MATAIKVSNGTVEIDGTRYVPEGTPITGDVRIVILQRGWVMVGRLDKTNPDLWALNHAAVIRVWGTAKGLPEIANGGPTSKTILDKCDGIVEFHPLTVIATLACREDKWPL